MGQEITSDQIYGGKKNSLGSHSNSTVENLLGVPMPIINNGTDNSRILRLGGGNNSNGSSNGNVSMKYRRLRPFKSAEIKVLLLENVSPVAANLLREAGYQVNM